MPAIANIAILDAKGTPVTHTFSPVTTDGSTGKLANRVATIPQGYETMSLEMTQPANATAAYRLKGRMALPTVAAVEGLDAVVRTSSATFELNFSSLSSVQDRKDLAKLLSNLFNHAIFVAMCENVEPLY